MKNTLECNGIEIPFDYFTMTREELAMLDISKEMRLEIERQNLLGEASDFYKELHGIRPRWIGNYTIEDLNQFIADLKSDREWQEKTERDEHAAHYAAMSQAFTPKPINSVELAFDR